MKSTGFTATGPLVRYVVYTALQVLPALPSFFDALDETTSLRLGKWAARGGQRCAAGRQMARERRLVRPTGAHVEARLSSAQRTRRTWSSR
eukprot:47489-Prymnesium_polylepis.1